MSDDPEVQVRLATPDDAPEIAGLIRAQYGPGYADPTFVDADLLRRRLAADDVRFGIARVGGRHAGQMAVERQGRHLWEFARALVRSEFRNNKLLLALDTLLLKQVLRPDPAARFFYARSVTHHLVSQRHALRVAHRPLGLLLGAWPAKVIEGPPDERPISALLTGRALAPLRPRRLSFGGRVREHVDSILGGLGVATSPHRLRHGGPLVLEGLEVASLGLSHLRLSRGAGRGATPREEAPRLGAAADGSRPRITWLDVPAEHPQAGAWIEAAEELGFVFGAYLPFGGTSSEDVVRLQRYRDVPLTSDAIRCVDEHVALREAVLADQAIRVTA